MEFRFIAAAASAALLAGELDAYPGFPAPRMLPRFEADPRFKVEIGSTEGEVILAMNNAKPPFPYATRSAEITPAQLAEAGIDARVENVEWGSGWRKSARSLTTT